MNKKDFDFCYAELVIKS